LWAKFIFSFFSGFAPILWAATILAFISWQPLAPYNINNLILAVALVVVIAISSLCTFYQVSTYALKLIA
jgi:hypothetical protein